MISASNAAEGPEDEFSAMRRAFAQVKSYRVVLAIPPEKARENVFLPDLSESWVICPDREKVVLTYSDGIKVAWYSHGKKLWTAEHEEGPWRRENREPSSKEGVCGEDAVLHGFSLRSETARQTGTTTVAEVRCDLWRVEALSRLEPSAPPEQFTVCIGPDRLPVQVTATDGRVWTYSDWNHVRIDTPKH